VRVEKGDALLAAATSVSIKPIQKRFDVFEKSHGAYRKADEKMRVASAALMKQQARVAEADVDQDAAAMELAGALAGDGFSRKNPFEAFGADAPAAVCKMGYTAEAEELLRLEKAVLKRKGLSSASIKAAKKMGAAAKRVLAENAPLEKLQKARSQARGARDALELGWETSFAELKRAARVAEDEGAKGLFGALFERTPKPVRKKKGKGETAPDAKAKAKTSRARGKKAKQGEAAPAPVAAPAPAPTPTSTGTA
jgi:hypothetical protein